jgi:hypothetical protein
MNKFVALLFLYVVCIGINVYALGNKEKDGTKLQNVEVSGIVRMVGSSAMTSIVITGDSREWYIDAEEQKKFINLQQQIVTVKASEYYRDLFFANGRSAGRFYYLKNIVILSPKQ